MTSLHTLPRRPWLAGLLGLTIALAPALRASPEAPGDEPEAPPVLVTTLALIEEVNKVALQVSASLDTGDQIRFEMGYRGFVSSACMVIFEAGRLRGSRPHDPPEDLSILLLLMRDTRQYWQRMVSVDGFREVVHGTESLKKAALAHHAVRRRVRRRMEGPPAQGESP